MLAFLLSAGCAAIIGATSACREQLEVEPFPIEVASPMRYAREVVPIRLGTADGPVVGRLHPGAIVRLVHDDGAMAEVEVLEYGRGSRVPRHSLFVASQSLSRERVHAPEPKLAGRRVGIRLELQLTQSATDVHLGSKQFSTATCGPFSVLEVVPPRDQRGEWPPTGLRVAQIADRVELEGWVKAPSWQTTRRPCGSRVVVAEESGLVAVDLEGRRDEVAALPEGYRAADVPPDVIDAVVAGRSPIFWLVLERDQLRCIGWRWGNGYLRSIAPADETATWHWSFHAGYEVEHTRSGAVAIILLHGPRRVDSAGDFWSLPGWANSDSYYVVGADEDGLYVLDDWITPDTLRGWYPADAQRWYFSATACERARLRGERALSEDFAVVRELGLQLRWVGRADSPWGWLEDL